MNNEDQILKEAIEFRRKYQREYRKNNKEKVKKWNQDYWIRRSQKEKEKTNE